MTSKIKVDNINKVSDDSNIINKCGTTITLGASGDSINLASGATQSGFGRTGTVDWITTPKVTGDSPVTGVTGKGYFMNTSGGAITINLPAGSAGDIISMADYAGTWQTSNVTVSPNGTEKMGGVNADVDLNTEGQSVTLVYVDGTQGWINTMDSTSNVRASSFIVATVSGSCNTLVTAPDCANYKIATFKNPGTFCVSAGAGPVAVADYLIVAAGAGGGADWGGGGGAGGLRAAATTFTNAGPSAPLTSGVSARSISVAPYSIVVGGGGTAGGESPAVTPGAGNVSSFDGLTSAGGGGAGGSSQSPPNVLGSPGGSGGGARVSPSGAAGGTGNTPPVSPPQGNNGGPNPGAPKGPGGGGGGIAAGQAAPGYGPNGPGTGGVGGAGGGFPTAFGANGEPCGSYRYFAGGGAGGTHGPSACAVEGGVGGGGNGGIGPPGVGGNGTASTGGGAGGAPNCGSPNRNGGTGGSGIVVIRYKFQ